MLNGRSGYVLQPPIMRDDTFDPFDRNTVRGIEEVTLVIEVLLWVCCIHVSICLSESRHPYVVPAWNHIILSLRTELTFLV